MYVSRTIAHLVSILLLLLPLPRYLAHPQELDLLPEYRDNSSLFLRKSRIVFLFQLSNLYLQKKIQVHLMISCQSFDKVFRCSHFVLMSGSEKLSLSMRHSTSRRFALIIQAFSFSRCNQLNSFLRSTGWECAWERSNRLCTRTARKWTRN